MKSAPKGKAEWLQRVNNPKPKPAPPTFEVSDKPEKKPLFLIMQQHWFDEILNGRKDIEYRDDTPFYRSRLLTKDGKFRNYDSVIMQVGYHANARRMTVKIEKIVLTYEFQIHLGEITDRNF